MVTKKPKGLGRGLEALLGPRIDETATATATPANPGMPASLRLQDMVPGTYQPRTRMDEGALYELAESIRAQGIMQPILVRRLDDEQARQRRAQAAEAAAASGTTEPPASPGSTACRFSCATCPTRPRRRWR